MQQQQQVVEFVEIWAALFIEHDITIMESFSAIKVLFVKIADDSSRAREKWQEIKLKLPQMLVNAKEQISSVINGIPRDPSRELPEDELREHLRTQRRCILDLERDFEDLLYLLG